MHTIKSYESHTTDAIMYSVFFRQIVRILCLLKLVILLEVRIFNFQLIQNDFGNAVSIEAAHWSVHELCPEK